MQPRPRSAASSNAPEPDAARGGGSVSEVLVQVAERELLGVLLDESLPAFGSYLQPSVAEAAALDRAVWAICREAHRLDLRAEQLVIGVKAAWSRIAAERKHRLGERDGDVLRTVVSWSIEVFFDSRETEEEHRTMQ